MDSEKPLEAVSGGAHPPMPSEKARLAKAYWRANIKVLTVLLTIWATPSLLLGIILVEPLNRIMIGGFPLGFWFAQQGSTITFVLLILAYALIMDKLDKKYIGENENE